MKNAFTLVRMVQLSSLKDEMMKRIEEKYEGKKGSQDSITVWSLLHFDAFLLISPHPLLSERG